MIQHFVACIGDSIELEYDVKENNISYTFNTVLQSGDIFYIDSKANNCSYRVSKVLHGTKPDDLCVRDGALLVRFVKK